MLRRRSMTASLRGGCQLYYRKKLRACLSVMPTTVPTRPLIPRKPGIMTAAIFKAFVPGSPVRSRRGERHGRRMRRGDSGSCGRAHCLSATSTTAKPSEIRQEPQEALPPLMEQCATFSSARTHEYEKGARHAVTAVRARRTPPINPTRLARTRLGFSFVARFRCW